MDGQNPPRENLYRAHFPSGIELREDASGDGGMPTMTGHFTVFNQWAEISSRWEGHFLERFAPGSLTKTFAENGDKLRVMFQHGKDPQIGEKLLGVPTVVREDGDIGGYYEVPLFDTTYNRDLLPGLKANAYGASMRFTSMREEYNDKAQASSYNPDGLPERTIKEARIAEAGPVVWAAYAGATSGVRSITDLIHDIDAVSLATPILLDDERLGHARAFISRGIPPEDDHRAEPDGTDSYSTDAPADHDAEPAKAHLSTARRVPATGERWWKSVERKVPTSWE
jgi:phage head maturation protease